MKFLGNYFTQILVRQILIIRPTIQKKKQLKKSQNITNFFWYKEKGELPLQSHFKERGTRKKLKKNNLKKFCKNLCSIFRDCTFALPTKEGWL